LAHYDFKLPDIGEGVTEGEIVAWCEGVSVGARIGADQPLVEVMTDKATVTITCPRAGTIVELGGKVGEVVAVGKTLAVLEVEAGAAPEAAGAAGLGPVEPARTEPAATAVGDIREALPGMTDAGAGPVARETLAGRSQALSARKAEMPLAAPATRKLARELGVELRSVPGSGPSGRVTQQDVRAFAASAHAAPRQADRAPVAIAPLGATGRAEPGIPPSADERVALRGVRKRIFEQMARSKGTAAHFTFVEECDVTELSRLRAELKPLAARQGVALSYLPFVVKACVAALRKHPWLNAAFDETTNEIVVRRVYNIGIATATDAGLMVPVVKHAGSRTLLEVAREIERLSSEARAGTSKLQDLQGSTFTITSLGAQGGLFATPILNFPEVAILGVHRIKQRPVVRNGQIVVGEVMLLSLSFDHRIIDGHVGAAFAYEVIGYLEQPGRLMLQMA
jgi:pyruvate dehydrogenase E2 component (dihydrolipoamide acetyltransferase)